MSETFYASGGATLSKRFLTPFPSPNFCRPHMTLKTTPAVAAGMASEPWSMERLLRQSARASFVC